MLSAICYTSTKSEKLNQDNLKELISNSIINNRKNEISGVLIEYKSNFLQYIEGPSFNVLDLFSKIKNDYRHHSVFLIQQKDIEHRVFPNWNMLFKEHNKIEFDTELKKVVHYDNKIQKSLGKDAFWKNINIVEYLSNLV